MPTGTIRKYSFRAPCVEDLNRFFDAMHAVEQPVSDTIFESTPLGDGEIGLEFDSRLTLASLHVIVRTLDNMQVVIQTLRECPLTDNSLECDSSVTPKELL